MDIWVVSSFLAIMESALWTCVHKFLFPYLFPVLLGKYLAVELLEPMVILCLAIWETDSLFSTVAAPFYTLTTHVGSFQFLHTFINTYYFPFKKKLFKLS